MDFLGTVDGITSEGRIVVRCEQAPDIGDAVFDQNQKRIGTVKRVFGPVDGPYASVSPTEGVPKKIEGKKLYCNKRVKDGKTKRRN
ncbi:H/ACA ribonucleoprotein complex subunit GAR1 [Methanomethylophilus alvi]|uniref:H/ACA ribonucleoprotein complex subunit GAR1 n=1 Tax=Methanomethylophilus alvi TaxID=1291540 RepID=UPI002AA28BB0|nr:Gar1/Naf1 family protein [Methanomethylophilus alvi]